MRRYSARTRFDALGKVVERVAQNRFERKRRYFFFAFFALFFAFFAPFFAFFAAMMTVPFSALADRFCFRFVCCCFDAGLALDAREPAGLEGAATFAGPPTPLPTRGRETDRVLARGRGTASR